MSLPINRSMWGQGTELVWHPGSLCIQIFFGFRSWADRQLDREQEAWDMLELIAGCTRSQP